MLSTFPMIVLNWLYYELLEIYVKRIDQISFYLLFSKIKKYFWKDQWGLF